MHLSKLACNAIFSVSVYFNLIDTKLQINNAKLLLLFNIPLIDGGIFLFFSR